MNTMYLLNGVVLLTISVDFVLTQLVDDIHDLLITRGRFHERVRIGCCVDDQRLECRTKSDNRGGHVRIQFEVNPDKAKLIVMAQ